MNKKLLSILIVFILLHIPFFVFPKALIFDEQHYVPVSHHILEGAPNTNYGHPPLAKLFMTLGLIISWDNLSTGYETSVHTNPFAWRFFSLVFGVITLLSFYYIVRKHDERLALLSTLILAFENLFFIHSGIGMLDIFYIGFSMMALYLFINKKVLESSISSALAICSKLSAIPFLAPLILSNLIHRPPLPLKRINLARYIYSTAIFLFIFLAVFGVIAFRYQGPRTWRPPYLENEQLSYLNSPRYLYDMMNALSFVPGDPNGSDIVSRPLDWYIDYIDSTIIYYRINSTLSSHILDIKIPLRFYCRFVGQPSFIIWFSSLFSIPASLYYYCKKRDEIVLYFVMIFLFNYFFWFTSYFLQRVTFIFYTLPLMPSLCFLNLYVLDKIDHRLLTCYVVSCIGIFIGLYYPYAIWLS